MKKVLLLITIISISNFVYSQADYETNFLDSYLQFEQFFQQIGGDYGTTFFPFLTLGYGGRERGLSGAFTAVADDISTLEINPAGTASLKFTELFFSHNKLMGDVNYNTLAYAMRFNDLGVGAGARVLYMPFTHFDQWGANVGSGLITYSVFTLNTSYNFLRSYKYFGLSAGANVKLYVYGIPEEIAADQSRVNLVFDVGLLTRFNFLKFYNTYEKNFSIGLAARNMGPFTDDEPPPTTLSLGVGWKPLEILLVSIDFNYLINYSELTYKNWSVSSGVEWKFTKYSSLVGGVTIKSSPSFALGIALDFEDFKITAVYNPDFVDVSKFSISASLKMGDMGREKKRVLLKKMYSDTLKLMADGNYTSAQESLKEILKTDYAYTPAKKSLAYCIKQIETEEELKKIFNSKRLK